MTTTALPTPTSTPTRRRFTVDEFLAMDQAGIFHAEERLELLDGEVCSIASIGVAGAHGIDTVGRELIYRLRDRALVRVRGPVQLDDLNLPIPDSAVLRLRDDYHRAHPAPTDVFLIVEAYDDPLLFDRKGRLPLYAEAGIPEVWIANVVDRQVEAFHDPVDGVYQSSRIVPTDGRISPRAFPDVVLTVGDFLLGAPSGESDDTDTPGTNP